MSSPFQPGSFHASKITLGQSLRLVAYVGPEPVPEFHFVIFVPVIVEESLRFTVPAHAWKTLPAECVCRAEVVVPCAVSLKANTETVLTKNSRVKHSTMGLDFSCLQRM